MTLLLALFALGAAPPQPQKQEPQKQEPQKQEPQKQPEQNFTPGPPMGGPDGGLTDEQFEKEFREMERKAWAEATKDLLPDGGRKMSPPFRWALKNVVQNIEMPGMQESQGIPVKLHAVRVKNNLRGVLEEVVDEFQKQGLYIQPIDQQPQFTAETAVTAVDTDRFISYSAIIRCEPKLGICTVVLGEANIGLAAALKQLNRSREMFVPLPPTAKGVTRSSTEGMESLAFSVSSSEAELKKWYATELPKVGYQPVKGKEDRYTRGTDLVQLTTRRHEGEVVGLVIKRTRLPGDEE